jgi:predicted  nucleic acid-binding Zn-ribbon protein
MDQVDALLELQDLDLEILRAKKRLDELPEKHAILEVRAKQREVAALGQRAGLVVHKLESELKAHQDEISMLAEKISGEQAKVMATTDHRQIQSLSREMDGLKRRSDKVEMESMQLMERIDKAKAQADKVDEALAGLKVKDDALVKRFQEVGGELKREIATEESRRAALAKVVAADLLGRYETTRESRGGVGVGRLEGNACSACRMELPMERLAELKAGPEVGVCPQCRRLIVVRPGDKA